MAVCTGMTDDRVHATLTVNGPVQAVFDVLADPTKLPGLFVSFSPMIALLSQEH